MNRRTGPRIAVVSAIFTLVTAGVGLIAMLVLNAFVLDEFDAYGEVPVPGSTSLRLPAGEVKVSFHTVVMGGTDGGFPVPDLNLSIVSPEGVPDAQVTADFGSATTVNNDARVTVWVVQVPAEGTYDITADGDVGGYISPRLAFGHGSAYGWLTWVFAGLLAFGVVELAVAITWSMRSAKRARPLEPAASGAAYVPSDQGIRLEQIRQLAALRDSGALTPEEYEAEKRRILQD